MRGEIGRAQAHIRAGAHTRRRTHVQAHTRAGVQTRWCTRAQVHSRAGAQTRRRTRVSVRTHVPVRTRVSVRMRVAPSQFETEREVPLWPICALAFFLPTSLFGLGSFSYMYSVCSRRKLEETFYEIDSFPFLLMNFLCSRICRLDSVHPLFIQYIDPAEWLANIYKTARTHARAHSTLEKALN